MNGRKVVHLNERVQKLIQQYDAADDVGKLFIECTAQLAAQMDARDEGRSK